MFHGGKEQIDVGHRQLLRFVPPYTTFSLVYVELGWLGKRVMKFTFGARACNFRAFAAAPRKMNESVRFGARSQVVR